MLAKTFKTAEDLKISTALYDALVQVYWLLTEGKIPEDLFDMGNLWGPKVDKKGQPCGTAGCILGWCGAVDRKNRDEFDDEADNAELNEGKLHDLFYPGGDYYGANRQQAAYALKNYLTTGNPHWKKAFAKA